MEKLSSDGDGIVLTCASKCIGHAIRPSGRCLSLGFLFQVPVAIDPCRLESARMIGNNLLSVDMEDPSRC